LEAHQIKVPRTISFQPYQIDDIVSIVSKMEDYNIELPCVVKPAHEGSSLGVSVVFHKDELINALHHACTIAGKKQPVMIQEKLSGMEFACIIITDYRSKKLVSLTPTEIVPEDGTHFFCYEQKYMPGRSEKHTPARCSQDIIKKIEETCVKSMQVLGMTNIARVDGFVTKNGDVVIIDPNSLSGMDPASFIFRAAAEHSMNHTQLINHIIETELYAYGMLEPILNQEKKELEIMQTKKLRIAVLLGGSSNEKEISLASGRNVCYKLSPHKYEVIPVFVSQDNELYPIGPKLLIRNSTKEIESLLQPTEKIKWADLPYVADFVFIGLHGGMGENGSVQGALEMLNLPYNGSSVLASALCMDKYRACNYLRSCGFDVPQGQLLSRSDFFSNKDLVLKNIMTSIPCPLIIKPHDDGCSVLVQQAITQNELTFALENIFTNGKDLALVEECISGMELTVSCIGNETPFALPPSQTVAASSILSIQEKFLPGAGENQTPAPLPASALSFVRRTIEEIYIALNLKGYCRIDCFYQKPSESPTGKERLIFIEANTLPGMTPATCIFHQAAEIGLTPAEFIDKIVAYGLQERTIVTDNSIDHITLHEI
jgi:D-alanine-D-alanine ligase